jgi:hypothetical protein
LSKWQKLMASKTLKTVFAPAPVTRSAEIALSLASLDILKGFALAQFRRVPYCDPSGDAKVYPIHTPNLARPDICPGVQIKAGLRKRYSQPSC